MRSLLPWFLFTLSGPVAHAALLAHVETDRGTVVVELQHDKAPQAVANFITLAEGTRPRIVDSTGAMTYEPMYLGEKFFRVINIGTFKIAQTGSGTGVNSGGPGFTFKDEFDPTLRHVPYVLSMANSGPNTNGSQLFLTGDVTIPWLDDVHTVFGLIPDSASRTVVDAILSAGTNGSEITAITFTRTDPAAAAFDEHAQNLPVLFSPGGRITSLVPGTNVYALDVSAVTGSVVRADRSTDLKSWSNVYLGHAGITQASVVPILLYAGLGDSSAPAAFYHITQTDHPGSVSPSSLARRELTIDYGTQAHIFDFNSTGSGGTIDVQVSGVSAITGTFTLLDFSSGGHHCVVTVQTNLTITSSETGETILFIPQMRCGWDSTTNFQMSGRHVTNAYDTSATPEGFSSYGAGDCTLTR